MMEFLLSVLSSIIGNLLTPTVKDRLGVKDAPPQPPHQPDPHDEAALERRRRYVREQWEIYAWTAFVFFTLILFVGMALAMPVAVKTNFFNQSLACVETRAANLCADGYWNVDAVKKLLIPMGIVCATTIWFLAQLLADPIAHYVHGNWRSVGPVLYRRILGLTIMFLAFLLCGHWIYFLFPSTSYWMSLVLPFAVMGIVGMAMSSRR